MEARLASANGLETGCPPALWEGREKSYYRQLQVRPILPHQDLELPSQCQGGSPHQLVVQGDAGSRGTGWQAGHTGAGGCSYSEEQGMYLGIRWTWASSRSGYARSLSRLCV